MYARVTRVPPRDFAFWAKSLRGQKKNKKQKTKKKNSQLPAGTADYYHDKNLKLVSFSCKYKKSKRCLNHLSQVPMRESA